MTDVQNLIPLTDVLRNSCLCPGKVSTETYLSRQAHNVMFSTCNGERFCEKLTFIKLLATKHLFNPMRSFRMSHYEKCLNAFSVQDLKYFKLVNWVGQRSMCQKYHKMYSIIFHAHIKCQ